MQATPILSKLRSGILLALLALPPGLSSAQEAVIQSTVITSNRLEMQGTPDRNYFYFTGDVVVNGTNLRIVCDELTVVAMREGSDEATIGRIGAIQGIIARGAVQIHQAGRSAFAGLAEVDPSSGTVTLSNNPRIVDGDVEVEGYQFVLHKGDRKFESVPDPNAPAERPSRSIVRLGAMPDLGFDQSEESVTVDDRINVESPPTTNPETDITNDTATPADTGEDGVEP